MPRNGSLHHDLVPLGGRLGRAVRFATAGAVGAVAFFLTWLVCQRVLGLNQSTAQSLAGVTATIILAPLAWWASREERVPPSLSLGSEGGTAMTDTAGALRALAAASVTPQSPSWPATVGLPPLRAGAFQERPELRDAIDAALVEGGAAVVTEVMAGDGGTGKTQLAAATFARTDQLDLRIWVSATSREAILSGYAEAAEVVRTGHATEGAESRATAFLSWLAATDKSWLVVLDDVAEPSDMRGLWPQGHSGRVLVTTRRRDAALIAHRRVVNVGVFTPREARAYLSDKLSASDRASASVLDEADELAADMGYLPLALAHASAVILDDAISCADYRVLLADRTRSLVDLFPRRRRRLRRHTGRRVVACRRSGRRADPGPSSPTLAGASGSAGSQRYS